MRINLINLTILLNFFYMAEPIMAMDREAEIRRNEVTLVSQTDRSTPDDVSKSTIERISFFDSKIFDAKLARELEQGKESVEIDITGRVPINSIPSRIDRWISKSAEEGRVEIKQQVASRSLLAIIPLIFNTFGVMKNYQEEKSLNHAKNYDVVIFYKNDDRGEALISKIVMTKRK